MAGIFNASIFNDAIFNTDSGVTPPVVVEQGQAPAGVARRRRYIMPDGTMLEATTQEAFDWLQRYSVPRIEPAKAPQPRAEKIRMPAIVLKKRDVRFIPATDAAPDTWQAVISERYAFKAPPEAYRQAEMLLNRIRADEEAIVALLM